MVRGAGDHPLPPAGLLAGVSLFSGLSEPEAALVASALRRVDYPAGATVVRQGEAGSELFIVEQGELTVTMESLDRAVPVARLGPSDVFGEMAVLRAAPRSASVTADTALVLWSLSRGDLDELLQGNEQLAQRFADEMRRRDLENALRLLQ